MDEMERAKRNLKKNDPASLKKFGETLMAAGKPEQAVEAFSQALDLRDGDPAILNLLGNAWRAQKRHEEAAHFYGKAVAAAPNYAVAHASLGDSYLALERIDEAVASLETSLKLAASEATRMSLAFAYRKAGKDDLALSHYKKLIEINPRNFRARFLMIRIYEDRAQLDEAYLCARELAEMVKNGPLADEARDTVRRINKRRKAADGEEKEGGETAAGEPPSGAGDGAPEPGSGHGSASSPVPPDDPAAPDPMPASADAPEEEIPPAEIDGEVARLQIALLRDPLSVPAHLRLAHRFFELSQFDRACFLYRKAVELLGVDLEPVPSDEGKPAARGA